MRHGTAAPREGSDTMAATRDYIGFVDRRFDAAARALAGEEPWMAPPSKPYNPTDYGPWATRAPDVIPELRRQRADWRVWYDRFGTTAIGWMTGYSEVQAFDVNLSRLVAKAKKAGANVSAIPPGRHDDPLYKDERDDRESNPLKDAVTVLKWGVIGYLAVQVIGAARK